MGRFLQGLFGLQVFVFIDDVLDARAVLLGVQVVVADNQCLRVTPVKALKEPAQGSLLGRCPRVGGLTANVQTALIAHADGVAVVVHAVGADHVFRTTLFD